MEFDTLKSFSPSTLIGVPRSSVFDCPERGSRTRSLGLGGTAGTSGTGILEMEDAAIEPLVVCKSGVVAVRHLPILLESGSIGFSGFIIRRPRQCFSEQFLRLITPEFQDSTCLTSNP